MRRNVIWIGLVLVLLWASGAWAQTNMPQKVRLQDGAGNAITSATRGSERPLSVQLLDASGNQITAFTGGAVTNAGTFAVQVDGAALTALQLIDDLVLAIGSTTSGSKGLLGLCAATASAPTYTTGQNSPCSLTTDGAIRMYMTGSAVGAVSNDDDGTVADGATGHTTVLPLTYAWNSDSGVADWTRWMHQPLDFDSGAGTENLSVIGIGLPASGGPVIGGTSTNPFSVSIAGDTQTGGTMYHYISVGTTEDEHQVKSGAGRLLGVIATNTNASTRYLRCADQVAASTTPGTTSVWFGGAIPGGTAAGGYVFPMPPKGAAFSTGLTCWLVTGAAETDVAEVAANEINVNYIYE